MNRFDDDKQATSIDRKDRKRFRIVMMLEDSGIFCSKFSAELLKSLDEEIEQQENIIKRDLRVLSYRDRILKENKSIERF